MSDPDETAAYDGSRGPQRRELTPRERDIVCRLIRDVLFMGRAGAPKCEYETLAGIFDALDPRRHPGDPK